MEAGEENGGNVSLKRPRVPLSDSEDNIIFSAPEMSEGQKRRRLEAADQENRSPKSSSSGRLAELEMKPDTPMVPSVRSRVQQLAQSREGGSPLVQRCCSDEDPSVVLHDRGYGEHLLGEEEFNQRMDRFKVPVFQASPATTPSPANPCPRTRSDFVSGIQQKLQGSTTPSSKQASRMRQEREEELSQLHFQPISENVWLKRSNSDPSLTEQVQGDAEIKDGSFTEAATSSAEKPLTVTGQRAAGPSEAPAAPAEFESSGEGRSAHHSEEVREEEEHKASVGNEEEQLGSHPAESQTVMMLSFSSDHSFSKAAFSEDQIVSELPRADEQRFAESTSPDESNLLEATEEGSSERFTFDEDEKMEECLYSEEEIEPLSDEELKTWRYPRPVVSEDQEVFTKEEGGELGCRTTVGLLEEKSGQEVESEPESCLDDSAKDRSTLGRDEEKVESCEGALTEDITVFTMKHEQKETDGCFHEDETRQQSRKSQTVSRNEDVALKPDSSDKGTETEAAPFADEARAQTETPTGLERNIEDVAPPAVEAQAASSDVDGDDGAQSRTEIRAPDRTEEDPVDERQGVLVKGGTQKAEGGESSKKVTFVLKPEVINTSVESSLSEAELSSHDETNTAEIIDQMFEEVLEYAGRMEGERRDAEEHDSGIVVCSGDKDNMDTEPEKEKGEEEAEPKKDECDESRKLEGNGDELLTFPQSGILSPLSKSVEAVVTPLRLAAKQESNPPSLLLTPDGASIPPAESAPLYSIDAYRTQRQSKLPTIQSVTPGLQRRAAETSKPQPSVNTKEKITALNEEAGKLQTVINQTLHALSCCTDEVHGRGSLEEAEAEKLLLVSCEKRSALLADAARLRDERSSDSGEAAGEDREYASQQPSRGTVGITNIQLPLKVEFVCSSHNRAGRPSHYFFILIRYGPCNIVATPLATAADAQNGDTISFPTSVTLKDIRSSFEIDVEVYSLSHTSGSSCSVDRTNAKSRVTPRKLLNTITRSSNSLTSAALPALNTRRSSNFCLVGSHKITLASLGHSKFPLDKMKLEGKIRRLLGDEFQEKVPFLSPLEGNIYLQLDSMSHSDVQHQGFLTMFELISGYGVWHRRYFVLEGCNLFYWNHPNDKETKEAEGSISLSGSPSRCVRPVKRDSCARPFTFELVSNVPQQQEDGSQDALAKCWFSADTKQERLDWMENLNQALLDFHTWNRPQTENRQSNSSVSGNLRESIL